GQRLRPVRRSGDRLALHVIGELDEIVRALGDAEEGDGAELAELRVAPAGEGLDADDPAAGDRDLRLEQDLDLVFVERAAKIDFEPVLPRAVLRGFGIEDAYRSPLPALRLGERGAAPAQQRGSIVPPLRRDHAGAAAQSDDMIARQERPPDRL